MLTGAPLEQLREHVRLAAEGNATADYTTVSRNTPTAPNPPTLPNPTPNPNQVTRDSRHRVHKSLPVAQVPPASPFALALALALASSSPSPSPLLSPSPAPSVSPLPAPCLSPTISPTSAQHLPTATPEPATLAPHPPLPHQARAALDAIAAQLGGFFTDALGAPEVRRPHAAHT